MPRTVTMSRAGSTPCATRSRAPSSATSLSRSSPSPWPVRPGRTPPACTAPARLAPERGRRRRRGRRRAGPDPRQPGFGDADLAASSEESEEERTRLIALVELARKGDSRRVRDALRPLPGLGLPVPLLPDPVEHARRGPHLRDLLPRAAEHAELPLAGQGLRRLADDHRPQPRHRPLQGRPHPPRADHRGHGAPRRRDRGSRARGARQPHQRDPAQGAHRAARASRRTA